VRVLNLLEICDCAVVFSFGAQCQHEFPIIVEFVKEHWFSRHWQREKLSVYHISKIAFRNQLISKLPYVHGTQLTYLVHSPVHSVKRE
jgi:hypothetical protein